MSSFKPNSGIPEHETSSSEFRKVLWTGLYSQVVIMTIPVGGDIGDEVHTVDQALTFTSGKGMATINGKDQAVEAGDLMVVPAGTQHQFVNTGDSPLEQGDKEEDEGIDEAPEWTKKSKKENEEAGVTSSTHK
ncbi:hypothetical protein M7I_2881 [Glarea lozoyensis 74030]|uniref:Cupin type-2 domain-containing protein n=1 Tax=Glarea lozoyensis (strain ATCC 74030 / MF5533) TaxID=1104152 RepID=H0EJZ7_GLAL7|nr:hypothetical protein M7I_2881 [Glarea lozoyensis 74030]